MTTRATLTQSAIDRAAKAAKAQGLKVKITARDGTVYEFTPLDGANESPQGQTTQFDTWKAKREGQRAGRS